MAHVQARGAGEVIYYVLQLRQSYRALRRKIEAAQEPEKVSFGCDRPSETLSEHLSSIVVFHFLHLSCWGKNWKPGYFCTNAHEFIKSSFSISGKTDLCTNMCLMNWAITKKDMWRSTISVQTRWISSPLSHRKRRWCSRNLFDDGNPGDAIGSRKRGTK